MKVLLGLLFLMLVGCSHSATIQMADGRTYEATIIESDAQFLYVRSELQERAFATKKEKLTRLKKNDVVDIDHPGNVHLLVGSLLAGIGALNGVLGLAILADSNNDSYNEFFAYQVLLNAVVYLGVGVPLGMWGWSTWDDSKTVVKNTDGYVPQSQPRLLLLPTIIDVKEAKMGLSLHLRF